MLAQHLLPFCRQASSHNQICCWVLYRVFFFIGKNSKYKKLIQARLGVSRPIYVTVDSPNLGFPYFNFLGGYQLKKHPVSLFVKSDCEGYLVVVASTPTSARLLQSDP